MRGNVEVGEGGKEGREILKCERGIGVTTKEGKVEEKDIGLCSFEGKRLVGGNGGTTTRMKLEGKEYESTTKSTDSR